MIYLFGDIHGDFRHVLRVVAEDRPAAIILLGDMEAQKPLDQELAPILDMTEVWWIPGNHDTDSIENYDNLYRSGLAHRNLHGRIEVIDGIRVAGLGGVFRGEIWYPQDPTAEPEYHSYAEYQKRAESGRVWKAAADRARRKGLEEIKLNGSLLKHRSTIFYDDWLSLYGESADILVTHEAAGDHKYGWAVLDSLAQSMRAKYHFHGHVHCHGRSMAGDVEVHSVGFRAVTDQYGGMIKAGE